MIKDRPELNTVFDERIAELEQSTGALETELEELEQGRVKTLLPGGNAYFIDLGRIPENDLARFLAGRNPLVTRLVETHKKKQELRRELGLEVISTNSSAGLVGWHNGANRWVKSKNRLAGIVLSSPWLVAIGVAILAIWAGPLALYQVSGGEFGGITPPRTKTTPANNLWTQIPAAGKTESSGESLNLYSYLLPARDTGDQEVTASPEMTSLPTFSGLIFDEIAPARATSSEVETSTTTENTPVATHNPSGTPSPAPAGTGRVGKAPLAAGGLNGPHGSFLAPSRLAVPALKLDTPVQRALTVEEPGGLNLSWPTGKEVSHFGAYPGEEGNMLILGTQESLAALRHLQQNDLISLYDRDGNLFRYRVLPFSPTGQTERLIDLSNPADTWVWNNTGEAVLTILVTPPPVYSGDNTGPAPSGSAGSSPVSGNSGTTNPDDYHRLAYRAVLALYTPATATPAGIPVAVPASVWQTSPAITPIPVTTPTISLIPAATPGTAGTPVPDPGFPGLPNTGNGYCYFNPCGKSLPKTGPEPQ